MSKNRQTSELINHISVDSSGSIVMTGDIIMPGGSKAATQSYVTTAISNLVDSSPATLDTLNELAAALGDDPNFATTVATSIGTKQPQLNGTGFVKATGTTISYDNSTYLTTGSASSTYLPLVGGTLTGALTGTTSIWNGFAIGNTPTSAGTSAVVTRYLSAGSDWYIGSESSVAGGFYAGASAYASVFFGTNPFQFITAGVKRFEIATGGITSTVGFTGTTATFSGAISATYGTFTNQVTVASPFTIKDTNPYIQWQNSSATRLGYIQHATNLVMTADSGNIVLNTTSGTFTLTSGGNIGIGTSSPFSKLDVSTSISQAICVGNSSDTITNGDLIGALSFVSRDASTYSSGGVTNIRSYAASTYNTGNVAADLRFYVSNGLQNTTAAALFGTEAMRISHEGNVGVNTPTPLERFSVTGNIHIAGVGNGLVFDTDASGRAITQYVANLYEFNILNARGNSSRFILGNASISLGTSATPQFYINTTSGNVGIGTTSPSNQLEIVGGNTTVGQLSVGNTDVTYSAGVNFLTSGTNRGFVGWRHTNSGSPFNLTGIHLFNTDNSNIVFGTNNTVKAVINVDGNLGIGTESPAQKLHVKSGTNYQGILINGSNAPAIGFAKGDGTTPEWKLGVSGNDGTAISISSGAANTDRIVIGSNANVGIGESPNSLARLNISGFTKINRSFYNWYQAGWQGNGTYWHMKTNMYGGAAGNTMYTMSLFKGYMYSYSDPSVREGAYGFHNWSGIIYNAASTGNLFTTAYNSSDGFVVLVIPSGNGETGVTIDWHQAFGYPFVTAQVTAAGLHGATTGKY